VPGADPVKIIQAYKRAVDGNWREPQRPPLWDGRAGERIVRILLEKL